MSSWILNESTGMMEQHLTHRDLMERRIMSYLNDHSYPYRYFDCGELGTIHFYVDKLRWHAEWVEVAPVPDDLPEWPGQYILDE